MANNFYNKNNRNLTRRTASWDDDDEEDDVVISASDNLEQNKVVAKNMESRIYGITDTVLNDPSIALYVAKGFKMACVPQPSTKGDLYFNILISDTEIPEGEKNEVARIRVASVINGTATVDNRFNMFVAQIRKELNEYVMEKRLNYWGRNEKVKQERFNLDDIKVG